MLLDMVSGLKVTTGLPLRSVCGSMHVAWSSYGRWRGRIGTGTPLVRPPGPAKLAPPDMALIKGEVQQLEHGAKRTTGTAALYARHRDEISRRELAAMVAEARSESNRQFRAQLQRVSWLHTGVAWSMDATEWPDQSISGLKVVVHQVQELCSRYKLPSMGGSGFGSEEIAGHLDCLCRRYGAPLFLKRDNAGNMNGPAVDDVLAEHFVLPLNSPLNHAQYNGAIEHAQGELKGELEFQLTGVKLADSAAVEPYARVAAHELNHRSRDSLKGRNPCQVFFDPTMRATFTKTQRRAAYVWIVERRNHIIDSAGGTVTALAAWRVAAKQWLLKNGLLTISINKEVSPYFRPAWSH